MPVVLSSWETKTGELQIESQNEKLSKSKLCLKIKDKIKRAGDTAQ